MRPLAVVLALLAAAAATGAAEDGKEGLRVLVTGAAGRTGSIVYKLLQADARVAEVRALVRNVTKARHVLHCVRCDASEGIYVGDVTNKTSLLEPARGLDTLVIAAGANSKLSQKEMAAVEFIGVENQVAALATGRAAGKELSSLRAILISSSGTTVPDPPPFSGGAILFWKLNAEAMLGFSGVNSVVVKPCGLVDGEPGKHALGTGFDDNLPSSAFTITRADVAAVVAQAVIDQSEGLRFSLCNGKEGGLPTKDLSALLRQARRPWTETAE